MFRNRSRMHKSVILTVSVILFLLAPQLLSAVPRRPVPAFKVQRADGSASSPSDWNMQGKWLLIYLEPRCGPCLHLLIELRKDRYPGLASHTIIVVGGVQSTQLANMQATFKNLSQAKWYADPGRNAARALNLHGAPVTLGIQDGVTRWGISGIPPVPGLLRAVLRKWSAAPIPPAGFRPASSSSH